ncbi:protein TNT, partial [Eptesicus fuscus]|uniref:protein TNT n=1 Tax=Eptesicus fuscus TaxID=29078 RepID=UPI002403E734
SLPSPDKHTQHPEASQGSFPLDKPVELPPTFPQDRKGDSCGWNAQGQDVSPQSPCLQSQPPLRPRHDTGATREPLRVPGSNLGPAWSSESSESSVQRGSLEKSGRLSQLSNGYAGDEESSEVSLVGGNRNAPLNRRLGTPAVSTQTSQLCAAYRPDQLKSQAASPAHGARQPGGET